MRRLVVILFIALRAAMSFAQCDTTGILLELQATTNLSGFLIGSDRCIANAILTSPLSFSGDTLSITKGNLTAGSSKVAIGGTGTGALLGAGANVDVVPANILLSTLGGALNLNQLSTTGASTNQIVKFNGTSWALGADDTGAGTLYYQTFRDNGTAETQRANANFVSSSRISWTLTDDAGNTETEVSGDIVANSIANSHIRQGVARSIVGVTGNATANVADIQGTTDQVLRVSTGGTSLAFGQIATGGITNSAVTYAKIQNAAANNVLLGNNNGAGTAYEEITMAALQTMAGYVDGVGVAGRHAYWTDANTLSNDADNLWDATNNRMTISNTVAGVGSNNAGLNIQVGAQTGPQEMLRMSGNVNGNMIMPLTNASNLAGSNVFHQIIVGGSAAGDPFIQYTITGGITTSVGIDNSDGDKFKFSPNASTPGQNVNNGIILTNDAICDVGINKDAPIHPLDVGGVARAVQFRNTGNEWNNSNIVFGTGAGTGATIGSVSGGSNGWQVNFNTGTSPVLDGIIFTATFPNPFGSLTYSTMEGRGVPGGINFNNERVKFVLSSESATTLVLRANGTLTASTQYAINFSTAGY